MTGEATYDVVIIGAGPVGENLADRVVAGGLSAAIVERELVGGECSYWACMPTKALLRSGTTLRAAGRLGVTGTPGPGRGARAPRRVRLTWERRQPGRLAGAGRNRPRAGPRPDRRPSHRHRGG